MSAVMGWLPWVLLGLAGGFGYGWLWYRVTRSGPGLVEQVKAKRRGEIMLTVTWLACGLTYTVTTVHDGLGWRSVMVPVSLAFAVHFARRARKGSRILNDPFLYLAAIRHDLGGESWN